MLWKFYYWSPEAMRLYCPEHSIKTFPKFSPLGVNDSLDTYMILSNKKINLYVGGFYETKG